MGLDRTRTLLVLSCAGAAALLAASQFTNLFELTPPGGEALGEVKSDDQHGYAIIVLAALSLVLLVVSLAARGEAIAQGAAFAVAVCGVVCLLIFLVIDLPDANSIGALDDESFIDAKAEPAAGFWLELVGALVLTACGAALATLRPEPASPAGSAARTGRSSDDRGLREGTPNGAPQRDLRNPAPNAAETKPR
ncbi:MAG TPA: hypothetical protein VE523_12080 [Solirubrobacterales bacterium]|jgi:amino acid transporter|nr:hypothetical protein [Solirubrobacterales bacterium]